MTTNNTKSTSNSFRFPTWLIAIGPLVLLAALVVLFIRTNPIQVSTSNLPPVEELSFPKVILSPNHFDLTVTNSGPDPVEIAQILIDEAYWQFEIEGNKVLGRLESVVIHADYPWVETEPFEIVIITS
ncbi:MAG: hypothetical protein IIA91_01915, partial [Chloroflexi bacterium]|nr:hypothetical protein [Chloroflexota bacterium]